MQDSFTVDSTPTPGTGIQNSAPGATGCQDVVGNDGLILAE